MTSDPAWWWSWALTAVGLTGLVLAGRQVWWAWHVNLAGQALWVGYALATAQYGFLAAAAGYTVVFAGNARRWTREHRTRQEPAQERDQDAGTDPLA